MGKNSVTNSKMLADIMLNKRSRAYKELCAICDEDGIQSDAAAAKLTNEFTEILTQVLTGNIEPALQKIKEHARQDPVVTVRPGTTKGNIFSHNFYTTEKVIRIAQSDFCFSVKQSSNATPKEILYGVLNRSLETGDIQHLELCKQCGKLFYRKSLKGRFCGNDCRWTAFNHREGREEKAHERYANRRRKLPGMKNAKIARRPRAKTPS